MPETVIELELRHINEKLAEIVAWQIAHSGEGHVTTHFTLTKRMDTAEKDILKAKTIWWVIAGVLASLWAGLLAWWKS
jgi:hypothetical protein